MEKDEKGVINRLKNIYMLTRNGLFLHGVRNNLAKIGIDIMPYYWLTTKKELLGPQYIKGDKLDLELSYFEKSDIDIIKSTIIGIQDKDLLKYLENGETCIGLKCDNEIVAYTFIRRNSFNFRKRQFNLSEKDAYLHSTYVFEKYRSKNIASYLRYNCFSILEKDDIEFYHSITEYFNKSAMKFQKKSNTKIQALYLSIVLFRRWKMNFTLKTY